MGFVRARHVSKRLVMRAAGASLWSMRSWLRSAPDPDKCFWALRDISFEVREGELLGVVGPNGAGKTTLLRLVSRIYDPTEGAIEVEGRVVPLLQIGAGFHLDLTGRDNVFVNAALLGVPRDRVDKLLDAIVDFSGIEKFIDVPVKYYSSGMYVRLAFSIALHSEPSVILTDEILAVGDLAFQAKCLDRFRHLCTEGVCGLFVSHVPAMVMQFCKNALYLEKGEIRGQGPAVEIIQQYITAGETHAVTAHPESLLHIAAFQVSSSLGIGLLQWGAAGRIEILLDCRSELGDVAVDIGIFGLTWATPISWSSSQVAFPLLALRPGQHRFAWELEDVSIWPGTYYIQSRVRSGNSEILPWTSAGTVTIAPSEKETHALLLHAQAGALYLRHRWEYQAG